MTPMQDDTDQTRRADDNLTWSQVELKLRVLLAEFRADLLAEIYARNIDPIKERVDLQDRFCSIQTQKLTTVETLLTEVVEAKLVRRMEVAESKMHAITTAVVVIGGATMASVGTLVVAMITHQLRL